MKIKNVGIIGLGYVGGPLAYLTAYNGYNVVGIDNSNEAILKINNRVNIPKQLKQYKFDKLNLLATKDYTKLKEMDIIIICVPTPTANNKPDLTILNNVVKNMGEYIKKEALIVLESTVAQGMTYKYVKNTLLYNNKLKINKDYYLAYCPERIDPGNIKYWVGNINRVCGGSSEIALKRAINFYKTIIKAKIIPMQSIEEAELVKVWENSIRNINIAQANLLAIICDRYNFSVKRISKGLNSKIEQFNLSLAYPGIGPGGHCIPEDIHYLIKISEDNIKVDMSLLQEAININENMPQYVFEKILKEIDNNKNNIEKMKILFLGISYKPNSNDIRRSQALVLYKKLKEVNNNIRIYDPLVKNKDINNLKKEEFEKYIVDADIVVLACAHDTFLDIDYTKYNNIKYILDCWNKLDKSKIISSGKNT